jgi:hypothetical protein
MNITVITVAPVTERPGYYTARCNGRLLCRSRQPFLDGTRALLAVGYPANTTIIMRHAGSATECLRARLGVAARLTVETNEQGRPVFRPWRGPRTRGAAPQVAYSQNSNLLIMEAAE